MNKKVKITSLVFILGLTFSFIDSTAQVFWNPLNSTVNARLNELSFVDSITGWAVGDKGTIIKTTNGGTNWISQDSKIDLELNDVFFLNASTGWALAWDFVGGGGGQFGTYILKTTNGGDNWTNTFYSEPDVYINTIYFRDSIHGWMGGYPGILVYTTNGGNTWEDSHVDSSFTSGFPIIKFTFYDSQYGFGSGGVIDITGAIFKTTNGGLNWESQAVGPEPIQQLHFFDSLNIIGAGGDFEFGSGVVTSSDAGRTWNYRNLNVFGIASAISFRNPNDGWCPLGFAQLMIRTTNGGQNWIDMPTPDSSVFYDLEFPDSTHGYTCGENGVIYKYNHVNVGITNSGSNIPLSPVLKQNFPNPFNPTTNIRYELPQSGVVTLSIFDINGKEVINYNEGFKTAGEYGIYFNADGLSSGIYYYRITIAPNKGGDVITLTKKMALVK